MRITTPEKILSAKKTDDNYFIETENFGQLCFNEQEFFKRNPGVRAGSYIVSCDYNCRGQGRWCKLADLEGRGIRGVFVSRYKPYKHMVACNRQFIKVVKTNTK